MPRLVDYGARIELIREAVVRIAARDGGGAVSLTNVAEELQVSPATVRRELRSPDVLGEMGLGLLVRLRQNRRFNHGRPPRYVTDLVERARWPLWNELPLDETRVEQTRAWGELVAHGSGTWVEELQERHDGLVDELVSHLLVEIEVPREQRDADAVHVRALVDGLTAGVCAGRISTEQVESCLGAHVRALSHLPAHATMARPEPRPENFSRAGGGAPR